MIQIKKRTKIYSMKVQPELIEAVQSELNIINQQKRKREKKTTISDLFEEKLYDFLLNCKK